VNGGGSGAGRNGGAMGGGNGEAPIAVRELTRRFGAFTAVDRVSFEVHAGEVFGFLGPNGAGKTTTIKMLCGLLAPTSGSGRVAGHDIASEAEAVKAEIGYMSQLFSLYGDLTVEENIAFFTRLYSVAGERRDERRDWVLRTAGLTEARHRRTGELPLGFKQRLALGCAVLHEPALLFLDEPTSGVDPITRRSFWDLIYELTEGGTTVLVSTHYMEEAEYCNRLALMNRGRLIALDRPAAIKASMHEPLFDIETDSAVKAVEALKTAPGILHAGMFGRTVHAVAAAAPGAEERIRQALAVAGVAVVRLKRIEPTLEDVFISRVQAAGGARED
jgi:drug efflux transport system ATP-binding protein